MKIDRDLIDQLYQETFTQALTNNSTIKDQRYAFAKAIAEEVAKQYKVQLEVGRAAIDYLLRRVSLLEAEARQSSDQEVYPGSLRNP